MGKNEGRISLVRGLWSFKVMKGEYKGMGGFKRQAGQEETERESSCR